MNMNKKFEIGDYVMLIGEATTIYEVIGFDYAGFANQATKDIEYDVTYDLKAVNTASYIDMVFEEDLERVDEYNVKEIIDKINNAKTTLDTVLNNIAEKVNEATEEVIEKESLIDKLLDEYNDYMDLHNVFGDDVYRYKAKKALVKLNKLDTYNEVIK